MMKDFIILMISKHFFWVLLSFVCIAIQNRVMADCDFTDFPTMPEMRTSALMGDGGYNNKPLMIRSFSADTSAGVLVNYYKRVWKDAFNESVFGPWQQISSLQDDCFMTVQYGSVGGSGTFGRLVISNSPEGGGSQVLGEDVLKPSDTFVVSDLTTEDGPKKGRVTMLTSSNSVSELVNFYRTEMGVKGWGLESNFNQGGGSVLVFRRGVDESNIVILPAGDASQILINQVDIN